MTNQAVPNSGFAPLPTGQVYYEVVGSGPALVLIHAGVADHHMWDNQTEAFAPFFQVIRYDLRGFGKTTLETPGESGSYSLQQDLFDLLEYLRVDRVNLIGLSLGGQIALDFTLNHPERVAALVLVASPVSGFDQPPTSQEAEIFGEMGQLAANQQFPELIKIWANLWVDGPGRLPDPARDKFRKQIILSRFNPVVPSAVDRLGEVKVPTLVMWGMADLSRVVGGCEKLVKEISGVQHKVFEDTAHMVNFERAEEFNNAVLNFLS